MDATKLINDFPAFGNQNVYPLSSIGFWLAVATQLVNASVWGDLANTGIELLAAHHMVLEARAVRAASTGAVGGITEGPVAGKTIDKVSITFAVEAAKEDGAGSYNSTIYGQRFWHLTQLVGAGGVQL